MKDLVERFLGKEKKEANAQKQREASPGLGWKERMNLLYTLVAFQRGQGAD